MNSVCICRWVVSFLGVLCFFLSLKISYHFHGFFTFCRIAPFNKWNSMKEPAMLHLRLSYESCSMDLYLNQKNQIQMVLKNCSYRQFKYLVEELGKKSAGV